jgi:hypothetical protein
LKNGVKVFALNQLEFSRSFLNAPRPAGCGMPALPVKRPFLLALNYAHASIIFKINSEYRFFRGIEKGQHSQILFRFLDYF